MNDLHRFLALMDDFGVEYHRTRIENYEIVSMRYGDRKVGGYVGFGAEFNFLSDGSFQVVGAYNTDPEVVPKAEGEHYDADSMAGEIK